MCAAIDIRLIVAFSVDVTPSCCLHGTKDGRLIFLTVVATPSLLLLPYLATAITNASATALQQTVGWLSPFPSLSVIFPSLSCHCIAVNVVLHSMGCKKKPVDCSLFHYADTISSLFFSPCCHTCTTTDMPVDCNPIMGFYPVVATSALFCSLLPHLRHNLFCRLFHHTNS